MPASHWGLDVDHFEPCHFAQGCHAGFSVAVSTWKVWQSTCAEQVQELKSSQAAPPVEAQMAEALSMEGTRWDAPCITAERDDLSWFYCEHAMHWSKITIFRACLRSTLRTLPFKFCGSPTLRSWEKACGGGQSWHTLGCPRAGVVETFDGFYRL